AQGIHSISARYGGDATFGPSQSSPVTQTVLPAPVGAATTTALASSANPSTAGQSGTFTATGTPAAGTSGVTPTGTATFTRDRRAQPRVALASSGGVATASLSLPLAAGTHAIGASYSGDPAFAPSTATALTQSVTATRPPAVVALQRF